MMEPPASLLAGCPPRHRVLTAVRMYYRKHGRAPSHADIARQGRVHRTHISKYLRQLKAEGLINYEPMAAYSIRLVDPLANFSDEELTLALIGRGKTVLNTPLPLLAEAFPIDPRIAEAEALLLAKLEIRSV